jgi:hypothetical protein
MSKFVVASALMSDTIVNALRRELRSLSGVNIDCEYLTNLLKSEIVKRDLVDGEEGKAAQSLLKGLQKSRTQKSVKPAENDAAAESKIIVPTVDG